MDTTHSTTAPSPPPRVSIVVPTCNRFTRLLRCIDKIRHNVTIPCETIVVDGASTDGTRPWLAEQPDLRVILEPRREGAVRAFNKGFRAATGVYVMWLNDDAYPLPGSVEAALAMLERTDLPDLGMVAFYHNDHAPENILHRISRDGALYHIRHVRGYPYANFGLIRRDLLARLGYADERYYFFGFDPDLSLKVQRQARLQVLGCPGAIIHHDEDHDERKLADLPTGRDDNRQLFEKWGLPEPGSYPDPTPAYHDRIEKLGLIHDPVAAV